jgi:hypothetical protein
MAKVKEALDKFIEESGMNKNTAKYKAPTSFPTKWGAVEYGWPAICPACGKTSVINTIQEKGKRLIIKSCRHSNKTYSQLKATDVYVRLFQENDYDSEEIQKSFC